MWGLLLFIGCFVRGNKPDKPPLELLPQQLCVPLKFAEVERKKKIYKKVKGEKGGKNKVYPLKLAKSRD